MIRHTLRGRRPVSHVASAVAVLATAALLSGCAQESVTSDNPGSSKDSAAGVAEARTAIAGYRDAITSYPEEPALTQPVAMTGKKVMVVPLGDNIPVIHGNAVGVQDAMKQVGASADVCDGKFTPTAVADCLKQAGDQKYDAVITLFIDYEMAGTAFDALAAKGVPVLIGGVAPPQQKVAQKNIAFYDNTARVSTLYETMSMAALAEKGEETQVLWTRLMDSTTTRGASEAGVAKFKELCPSCGVATADFTTANLDKLPSAVSAALVSNKDTNIVIVPVDSFVPQVIQGLQAAGVADKVKVVSSSSDLAGLQRVRDGQQVADLGTAVIYEGWKYANALMQQLSGQEPAPGDVMVTRNFTADNVGSLELTDKAYFTPDWFGDDSFKKMFLTAWGAK